LELYIKKHEDEQLGEIKCTAEQPCTKSAVSLILSHYKFSKLVCNTARWQIPKQLLWRTGSFTSVTASHGRTSTDRTEESQRSLDTAMKTTLEAT